MDLDSSYWLTCDMAVPWLTVAAAVLLLFAGKFRCMRFKFEHR